MEEAGLRREHIENEFRCGWPASSLLGQPAGGRWQAIMMAAAQPGWQHAGQQLAATRGAPLVSHVSAGPAAALRLTEFLTHAACLSAPTPDHPGLAALCCLPVCLAQVGPQDADQPCAVCGSGPLPGLQGLVSGSMLLIEVCPEPAASRQPPASGSTQHSQQQPAALLVWAARWPDGITAC